MACLVGQDLVDVVEYWHINKEANPRLNLRLSIAYLLLETKYSCQHAVYTFSGNSCCNPDV